MSVYFGVDIGGTTIKLGLFGNGENLLDKWEIPTRKEQGGRYIIPDTAEEIKNMLERKNISQKDILGIGLGIPGPVLLDGYVPACVNLNWKQVNPERELAGLLKDIPVYSGNDANVAALGEQWKGSGMGYDNLVMVTLGTGVGGAVILNGRIVSGAKGMAGEFGHISVNPDEKEICNCGNKGCLDQVASATGIVRYAGYFLQKSKEESCLRGKESFTAKDVAEGAKAKDKVALEALSYCMGHLGKCLAWVSHVIDPEVFIIGGGVSGSGSFLIELIEESYRKHVFLNTQPVPIKQAALGGEAGIYGAARIAFLKSLDQ
ncbi:ROK family glucokinase [Lachnospiraceae bacterium 62-35]